MSKKKSKPVKNGIAKDLRSPKYKMQVAKDKRRKNLLKEISKMMDKIDQLMEYHK